MNYLRFISDSKFSNKNSFLLLLSASALFMLPIINANIYYVDDISRAQTNFLGWSGLGRPVSDILLMIFSLGRRAVDVSPLPQILSVFINAVTAYVLLKCISKESTVNSVLISAIAISSPLYIQNMVYRYDSLSMSLAVLFSVYAFYIPFVKYRNIIIVAVSLVLSFCLYQATMPIFPILIMLGAFKLNKESKSFLTFIIKWAIVYLTSLLAYKVISGFFVTSTRGDMIFSHENWIEALKSNLESFYWLYVNAYGHHGDIIISFLVVLSFSFIVFSLLKRNNTITNNIYIIVQGFLSITFPLLSLAVSAIFISILSESLIVPRVALGFGFAMAFIIYTLHDKNHNNLIIFIASSIVLFISICSSYAVMSATKKQYESDLFLTAQIKTIIESNDRLKGLTFHTYGRVSESIYSRMVSESYPIARVINARLYDWTLATQLNGLGAKNIDFSFDRKSTIKKLIAACSYGKHEVSTPLYNIFSHSKDAYIVIGEAPKECRLNTSS